MAAVAAVVILVGGVVLFLVQGRADYLPVPESGRVSAQFVDGHPVFVVHDPDGRVRVLDAVSPHGPFPKVLAWCQSSELFEDLWHGSVFNRTGKWLTGPAPTGMAAYEVLRRDEDRLVVGESGSAPPRPASETSPLLTDGHRCDDRTALSGEGHPADPAVLDDLVIHQVPDAPGDLWYPTPERILGDEPRAPADGALRGPVAVLEEPLNPMGPVAEREVDGAQVALFAVEDRPEGHPADRACLHLSLVDRSAARATRCSRHYQKDISRYGAAFWQTLEGNQLAFAAVIPDGFDEAIADDGRAWSIEQNLLVTVAPAAESLPEKVLLRGPAGERELSIAGLLALGENPGEGRPAFEAWRRDVHDQTCPKASNSPVRFLDERGAIEVDGGVSSMSGDDLERRSPDEFSLWALVMTDSPTHGESLEIVFRTTGSGPTFLHALGPDSTEPVEFTDVEDGVGWWERRGDEVRTVWNLPHSGCWQINVGRADWTDAIGSIYIGVD